MRVWSARAAAGVLALAIAAGCSNPFGRKYEYEEQLYLRVDGSATVVVDSSIAALIALRNLPVEGSSRLAVDRDQVRQFYSAPGCGDTRVGQPWARSGRRFVQISIEAKSLGDLAACPPLAWSRYEFTRDADGIHYVQTVGAPNGRDPGPVNWDGSELVAFKLHAPSKIFDHNVKLLKDGSNGTVERGNILTWEQTLADRRAGKPLVSPYVSPTSSFDVHMGGDSILNRTLELFVGAFIAAVIVLAAIVWVTIRRARKTLPTGVRS